MPAARAIANQVADAVVALLATINSGADPNSWRTKPALVDRGVQGVAVQARPSLLVQMGDIADKEFSGKIHRTEARVLVHCTADGEDQLLDLMRDVLKVITDNDAGVLGLTGTVIWVYTDSTFRPFSNEDGLAGGTLDFGVMWEWPHGSP